MSILRAFGYPNRVIAILAPILAPLVGAFSSWLASKWPDVPKSDLNEIFLAGAIVAVAPALQFMHGQLKWDLQQDQNQAASPSEISTPGADEFAALGIESPAAAADGTLPDADLAEPEPEAAGDGVADDDLAGLIDTLDDEEEQEGLAEPGQPAIAGP